MAINERLIDTEVAAANGGGSGSGNQEEGLILHLDANDVDSYDGDGSVWYDITNHEYKPATNPSEHFNTVTYSGASNAQSITGVGFQPDMVWIKSRNLANNHVLIDSVRGLNGGSTFENLYPNLTNAQANDNAVSSLDSDGFSLVNSEQNANHSSYTYVAWCFKAGGAPTATNTATSGAMTANSVSIDGTLESAYTPSGSPEIYPNKMSVNTKLGFSIVEYEGTGNSNNTIPHGLGVEVELVILKRLDTGATGSWIVGSKKHLGEGDYLVLNTDGAASDFDYIPTMDANTFSVYPSSSSHVNANGIDHIAYCFASKRGVSKVGSYEGTGVSGNKVYTGFEPAWVMLKIADETGSWRIYDNVRGVTNALYPNLSNAEATGLNNVTFNRDGFTVISTGGSYNGNNDTYIYLAFAKDTNETDLIDDTDLELHLDAGDDSTVSTSTWSDKANSNDGTLSGFSSTLTDFYEKELGNYLYFDGTDDKITTTYDATTTNGVTVEVWFKQEGSGTVRALFGDDTKFVCYIGGQITGSFTDESIYFYKDGAIGTRGAMVLRLGEDYFDGKGWQHLAIVDVPSAKNKMYLNGEEVSYSSISGYLDTFSFDFNNFKISNGYSGSYFFKGGIGQLRVYEDALSQDQIRQNFNFTKNDYPNGYNAALTNMSSSDWNASGYFTFSANTDRMQTSFQPNITVPYSMSVWVNRTDYVTNGTVLDYTQNASPYNGIGLLNKSDGTCIVMVNGYEAGVVIGSNSSGDVYDHIVFVYNGGTSCRTYINGVGTDRTLNATPNQPNSSTNFVVGNSYNQYFNAARMKVSDVRFYDKQLTDSEVTSLYNEGSGVS